jgi:amino acid adenylation domain-containing protein/non-ribosomal peptide synthase protein (TIGR01720 family)
MSLAQGRIWFLDQLEPGSPLYIVPTALRLTGELCLPIFERSLKEIIQRHEALRTSFDFIDGQPMQIISPSQSVPVPQVDLSALSPDVREIEANNINQRQAEQGFDLSRGPLLRINVLQLSATVHIVLLTMHHIVSDGWSMSLLINEVATLYETFSRGEDSPLPELSVQYADYAIWQREWLQGEVLAEQLQYWRERLGGELPVLELPTDFTRPLIRSYRGSQVDFTLPGDVAKKLQELSQQESATMFMTLLAAFAVLLSRYSAQEEIVIGTDIAGRAHLDIEPLIGFFINQLALRVALSGNPTFRALLESVREITLGAYAHQEMPFEKLVEELQPERNQGRSPLFQAKLVWQNMPAPKTEVQGLRISSVNVENTTAKFDLTLVMGQSGDRIAGKLEYNTDLFERSRIERMAAHLAVLLSGIGKDAEQRVGELPLLTEVEREQLLSWQGERVRAAVECLQQLFEAQAERQPEAVAVVSGEQRLSYGELERRANQVAHYLRRMGVRAEMRVAHCMRPSPLSLVTLLGVLKAGGAYVPLEASLPLARLSLMLADSGAAVLLTEASLVAQLPSIWGQTVAVDEEWEAIARESEVAVAREVVGENLAYVLYTSGSTGVPKGVMVEHRAVVNYLSWARETYELGAGSGALLHGSLSFDLTVTSLWGPLSSGSRVVLVGEGEGIEGLVGALRRERGLSLVKLTPAHLVAVTGLSAVAEVSGAVGVVVVGGEALQWEQVRWWQQVKPAVRLVNEYGPTEATVGCSSYEVNGGEIGSGSGVGIGRGIWNTELYVLDEEQELVPVGVSGELYIGGAGLARGYLERAELTAQKFVAHPFSVVGGERLYRSGDLVRWQADGELEFLGRIDEQVKVRGYRVELGEVESVLRQHPQVSGAVVVVREGAIRDQQLVAYVVTEDGAEAPASELRMFLKEQLPEYMIPAGFVVLDELPLTASGKVDRRALPAPEAMMPDPGDDFVAARTPIEDLVIGIWTDVIGIKQISLEDNFFDLGGHSLLATHVIWRVREAFGVELPVKILFESPTVAAFAGEIQAALLTEQAMQAPAIVPVGRERELPLSFSQQRLWFLDQLEPGSPFYNLQTAVALTGSFNFRVFEKSFNEIIRRHEILRTNFVTVEGRAAQVISARRSLRLPLIDLSELNEDEQDREVQRLGTEDAQQPFDLSSGPLLRMSVLRLTPQEHVVLLTTHHIISDGWSLNLLVQEVATLCEVFKAGKPLPLAELPIQYADYAVWQRRWLQGEVLEQHMAYWRQHLGAELPVLELPSDRPRPAVQSYRGSHLEFALTTELTQELQALSRRAGTTLFMTMLSVFTTLLHRYTGQDKIFVGAPIAGRTRIETEKLIGFFVNTLVMRADLSGHMSFQELMGQVRERALGAYTHQELPFEKLVDELEPERDLSRSPLFQVMFDLKSVSKKALQVEGLRMRTLNLQTTKKTALFDLTLAMVEVDGQLTGALEYNTDLFDQSRIERLLGHLQALIESIVSEPREELHRLQYLTPFEQQQLLVEWNETKAQPLASYTIQQLFQQQAEQTPAAIAMIDGATRVTYEELNRRANQVAHYLRRCGIGPDDPVGLCVERSVEMAVGLLGILKASGYYVPLDSSYPEDRLQFIFEETHLRVLLTQQHLVDKLPAPKPQVLCLDTDWTRVAGESEANPSDQATPDNLAYVIYTSGSTGRPKGVLITHGALADHCRNTIEKYELTANDRVLQFSALSFDVAAEEIFPTLSAGATLVLQPEQGPLAVAEFLDFLEREKLTVVNLPASYWHELVLELNLSEKPLAQTLRLMITGSEKVLPERLAIWHRVVGNSVRWMNAYGPTETTVTTTVYAPTNGYEEPGTAAVRIGRPLANRRIYILDQYLQPAAVGIPGEIHIGGASLARGYFNDPGLTGEKFIPDPFGATYGARLYRSGDLGCYLPDGNIQFLSRADRQVKVRGFRIELGEIESVLRDHEGVHDAVVLLREQDGGQRQLVAYVVPAPEFTPSANELRQHLQARLPGYMLPASIVILEALPLTSSGKVDQRALPSPDGVSRHQSNGYVAPRTEVEATLAEIWADVLRLKQVGVSDNFFEHGGDSILSIQIISRANQAGLRLTPKQLFQHQTIAELATVVSTAAAISAEQGKVTGQVQLTPIQHWFFEQELTDLHHYNQALLFKATTQLDARLVKRVAGTLVAHHDALRLRFKRQGEVWQQWNADDSGDTLFSDISLAGLEATQQRSHVEAVCEQIQASLDLAVGPIIRVALFEMGADEPQRLLIVIHHLAVDGVSWRILLEDFQRAYTQQREGLELELPPKTTSFQQWAQRLPANAQSDQLREQSDFWLAQTSSGTTPLPLDHQGANTNGSQRIVTAGLAAEATQSLLTKVPAVYHTQIQEVLLAALVRSIGHWTGGNRLRVDLEGHGREELFEDVDLTRTVGWFTTLFPLTLTASQSESPVETLKQVKEQMRAIPERGIGFGLLRYLSEQSAIRQALAANPADIVFNYLGQFDQVLDEAALLEPAFESSGPGQSHRDQRSYLLEINASVIGGQLLVAYSYSEALHEQATIEALASSFIEALQELITSCLADGAGGYTPSDFPLAQLDQKQLDSLLGRERGIEDVYPLSPLQQAMLFYSLYDQHSEVLFEQSTFTLEDEVNVAAFEAAWQQVLDQHSILRTAFAWEAGKPLQIVHEHVALPLEYEDWSASESDEHAARMEAFLRTDRARGFELSKAPLMRVTLVKLSAQEYWFVWSSHHLLADGWSTSLILRDLFASYQALSRGEQPKLERVGTFRDFIKWLADQDASQAEEYWRQELKGVKRPTPLPVADGRKGQASDRTGLGEGLLCISPNTTEQLKQLARREQVTFGTIAQAAWAVVLSRYSGESDVIFGNTVSGRPAELPGVEEIVGPFINVLPVRVRMNDGQRVGEWLRELQERQLEQRQYEYSGLIQEWSEVPLGLELFQSILVFQNYPVDAELQEEAESIGARMRPGRVVTKYPLTLVTSVPGEQMHVSMAYSRERFDSNLIEQMLGHYGTVLEAMAANPQQLVSELPLLTQAELDQLLALNPGAYVLDRDMRLVPVGLSGELYLGGVNVKHFESADQPAESFVPHPFSAVEGERLYRTGQMACYLADGNIELLGSEEEFLTVRGLRLRVADIEAMLLHHDEVRQVAVVRSDEEFVAWVVLRSGSKCAVEDLKKHLESQDPSVAGAVVIAFLNAMPLRADGTVDREALRARELDQLETGPAVTTPVEEMTAAIVANVLGTGRLGRDANFFELGGHSLMATQVIARLREAFGIELSLRTLFEAPTVAGLAQAVADVLKTGRGIEAPPIKPVPRDRPLPLSFAQQRLWFMDQLEPGSTFYNEPMAVRLEGQLNVKTLQRTLGEIVRRHEVLRTTFAVVDGKAVQVIGEPEEFPLPCLDLTHLPAVERERAAQKLAAAEEQQAFDLSHGPLLRAKLLRLADEEWIVLLSMHHIVSDAWSSNLLVSEVTALYDAFDAGRPSPLPELAVQYADYAVWQRERLQGDSFERQLQHWRQQLSGDLAQLELPTDRPRSLVPNYRGESQVFLLPADLSRSLKMLSRRESATLFMTLLSAFKTLLYRYSKQKDIIVGTAIAGRNQVETEPLIGLFLNMLVMRTEVRGERSFRELLDQVKETALAAYANQDVPFERLVEELQVERSAGDSPLFQVAFGLQNTPRMATTPTGLRLSLLPVAYEAIRYDLTLWISEGPDGLGICWKYRTELFDTETIRRMQSHFETLLQDIIARPDVPLDVLEYRTPAEKEQELLSRKSREESNYRKLTSTKPVPIKTAKSSN